MATALAKYYGKTDDIQQLNTSFLRATKVILIVNFPIPNCQLIIQKKISKNAVV